MKKKKKSKAKCFLNVRQPFFFFFCFVRGGDWISKHRKLLHRECNHYKINAMKFLRTLAKSKKLTKYQFLIPPSFPAFLSLHSNSTSIEKPICPVPKILHCPEQEIENANPLCCRSGTKNK